MRRHIASALAAALLLGACASRGGAGVHEAANVAAPPAPYSIFTEVAPPPAPAADEAGTRKWWELDGVSAHSPPPPRWEPQEDEEFVLDYTHFEYGQYRRDYGWDYSQGVRDPYGCRYGYASSYGYGGYRGYGRGYGAVCRDARWCR